MESSSNDKITILFDAIWDGDLQKVKHLLDEGINTVEDRDSHYNTALINATGCGNYEMTKLLLKKGADPNKRGFFDRTPIFNAVDDSDLDIMKLLFEYGADLTVTETEKGRDLLLYAFRYARKSYDSRMEILRFLVNNIIISEKYTERQMYHALFSYYSPDNERKQLVKLLVEKGIKFNY